MVAPATPTVYWEVFGRKQSDRVYYPQSHIRVRELSAKPVLSRGAVKAISPDLALYCRVEYSVPLRTLILLWSLGDTGKKKEEE